ncbi:hypothetical protein DRH13_02290 [Candidatus Woesebacteria bacterium]|nr:MAG: hypothetical protein DRH13_02290 [Candidatus Woesebacteria bacterium]
MTDLLRSEHCVDMFTKVKHLEGQVAECGVGAGQTTFILDKHVLKADKKLYAFDTFCGLPFDDIIDNKHKCKQGEMREAGEEFINKFKKVVCTSIIPETGLIENTLEWYKNKIFCFVWLDLDLYSSTSFAYKFFENRMTEGGIIGFHDYGFSRCPGIKKVVDEEVDFDKYEFVANRDICYFIRRKK